MSAARAQVCGDGVTDAGEECDDGLALNSDTAPDACRTTCVLPSCGDGVTDTGEECDADGANSDTVPNACRTTCLLASCGDGVIDGGEQCDDGNAVPDDGCTSCSIDAPTCGAAPVASGCIGSDRSVFLLREANFDFTKHKLLWKWLIGIDGAPSDFGDPLNNTRYSLCVYDYSAETPSLKATVGARAGGICGLGRDCWQEIGGRPNGYRFRDVDRDQDSIAQIVLKADEAGRRTKILAFVRGTKLVFPSPDGGGFLDQDTMVKVQLINSDGACWEADYAFPATKNRILDPVNLFKDKCGKGRQRPCS